MQKQSIKKTVSLHHRVHPDLMNLVQPEESVSKRLKKASAVHLTIHNITQWCPVDKNRRLSPSTWAYWALFLTIHHRYQHLALILCQLFSLFPEKDPNCLVFTSLSWSSCRCPRRYKYSMCITSVFLMWEFSLNSSRIRGMNPGLSRPARRNSRYKARICFCSLLWRTIVHQQGGLWKVALQSVEIFLLIRDAVDSAPAKKEHIVFMLVHVKTK